MFYRLGILSLLFLLANCAKIPVSQDFRPGTDFTALNSYSWHKQYAPETSDVRATNPLLHERFRDAINRALYGKGITQGETPDFLVSYSYSIKTIIESNPMDTHVGFGFGRYSRYGGVGFGSGTSVSQYDVGTLVIDFLDPHNGRLLWRGSGSDRLSLTPTPENNIAFANKLVTSILAQFPPGI